ncbi:MAG: hypothetical protein GWN58_45325 [Anaerolineae bacterium]|nr:hypothetical protein [Anaerolineae bacterium]
MRGLRGRRKAPKEKVRYGEKGVKGIRYSGEMPCDVRGSYTGVLYAFNERRPLLGVDVRDLPGMAEVAGAENLEVRQDDGKFKPVAEILQVDAPVKAKPKRKPKPAPEPAPEEQEEEPQEQEEKAGGD